MVIRGTKKLLDRVGKPSVLDVESTGVMGDWYANALFWRPQVALFVNERTFLPVLLPLAPAVSVTARFPPVFAQVARRLGVIPERLNEQLGEMSEHVLARTASRVVLGVMNGYAQLADQYRWTEDEVDLIELLLAGADAVRAAVREPRVAGSRSPGRAVLTSIHLVRRVRFRRRQPTRAQIRPGADCNDPPR